MFLCLCISLIAVVLARCIYVTEFHICSVTLITIHNNTNEVTEVDFIDASIDANITFSSNIVCGQ